MAEKIGRLSVKIGERWQNVGVAFRNEKGISFLLDSVAVSPSLLLAMNALGESGVWVSMFADETRPSYGKERKAPSESPPGAPDDIPF